MFDLADLEKRTHELADFIASAAQHYKIDIKNIYRRWLFERRQHRREHLVASPRSIARRYPVSRDGAARARHLAGSFFGAFD